MNHLTADLIDAHGDKLQSYELQFRQYGGQRIFHGPVRTIKTLEDNALVKQLLSGPGHGAVLVIDGGGSLRTALLGDMIAVPRKRMAGLASSSMARCAIPLPWPSSTWA